MITNILTNNTLIFLLVFLSGLSNAIMDLSSENLFPKEWWNKGQSWDNKNKFKNPILRWLFRNPLVFLTDGWHLFQFLHTSFLFIAIILQVLFVNSLIEALLFFFVLKFVYGTSFTILYKPYKKYSLHRRSAKRDNSLP